jgi:hypothetical protein
MRIARAPSSTEGMTALHVAAQAGKTDLVRYLVDKGTNPELVDSNGRKPIDLVGGGGAGAEARGSAASAAAIRALLQNAASHK